MFCPDTDPTEVLERRTVAMVTRWKRQRERLFSARWLTRNGGFKPLSEKETADIWNMPTFKWKTN